MKTEKMKCEAVYCLSVFAVLVLHGREISNPERHNTYQDIPNRGQVEEL